MGHIELNEKERKEYEAKLNDAKDELEELKARIAFIEERLEYGFWDGKDNYP